MKIYIVKYCANEFDDLRYDFPYPIYYSLAKSNARQFFENLKSLCKKDFNDNLDQYPEFKNNEEYQFTENDNSFEYSIGKWVYEYTYEEREMETDLRYTKNG